ncbi:MAG: hypothetical protein GC162_00725 [Planctomycetes bacterium]|nr:hypothetical protein [Planctomycetota bacterium]
MVKGLDLFRDHFRDFADRYVLIGGTACDLIMGDVGLQFRATKDLDIVLCIEALDTAFAEAFWAFVRAGKYQLQETATGEKRFYRFQKPANHEYPAMLELFSRVPEALSIADDSHLTPIPIDDEVSSLSAILLDKAYYGWIHAGKREVEGVPIVGPEYLVPLKAKAWLDLSARAATGDNIDSKAIKKHKNDVFRLFQVIDPDARPNPPSPIAEDMRTFLDRIAAEAVNLKALGLKSRSLEQVIDGLRAIYAME